MSEIIKLLSAYNLFNSLLPGVVFVVFLKHFTKYDFVQTDILTGIFFYYFIGVVISRIGSLIIEPILKKFFIFKSYNDYIQASKKDQKIELLSEVNNMYRTLLSVFFCLLLSKLYERVAGYISISKSFDLFLIIIAIMILLIFSYKKQIKYIRDRIDVVLKKKK